MSGVSWVQKVPATVQIPAWVLGPCAELLVPRVTLLAPAHGIPPCSLTDTVPTSPLSAVSSRIFPGLSLLKKNPSLSSQRMPASLLLLVSFPPLLSCVWCKQARDPTVHSALMALFSPGDAGGPGAQPCQPPGDLTQSPGTQICLCTDHSLVLVLGLDPHPEGQMGGSNSTYTIFTWVPNRHLKLAWPKNELLVSTSTCSPCGLSCLYKGRAPYPGQKPRRHPGPLHLFHTPVCWDAHWFSLSSQCVQNWTVSQRLHSSFPGPGHLHLTLGLLLGPPASPPASV